MPEDKIAISSYATFLMIKKETKYENLLYIKDHSDLGGSPEMLDCTTMAHKMRVFIMGIQENQAITFTANYTLANYKKIKELEGVTQHLAVWFGGTDGADGIAVPTGTDGKFKFDGMVSAHINSSSVNSIVNMTVTVAASSPIVPDETAA